MDDEKRKRLFVAFIILASIIMLFAGVTFSYFSAYTSSNENAVFFGAAKLELGFSEDTSLIKSNLIPSEETYVDIASKRVDNNGNFLVPYLDNETNKMVNAGTTCIDDHLYEICSMYTFTVYNESTVTNVPIYIYLKPSINQFQNLYFKVLDSELVEVISKTKLEYNDTDSISLSNLSQTLEKSIDSEHLTSVTYTIVFWIDEIHDDQTVDDSGKLFASTVYVNSSNNDGNGLTAVVSLSGTEG